MTSTMPRVRQCIAMLNKAKSPGMSFFSLPPADSACYAYQMNNRQHAPHARLLPKWAFARFYKKNLTERSYRQIEPNPKTTTGGMNRATWLFSIRQNQTLAALSLT